MPTRRRSTDSRLFAPGIHRISARSTGHAPCGQDAWELQGALDKGLVDHNLGSDIREFASLPGFYLLSHGLKVPLHSVDPDRDAINQRKRFRVFGEHWPKHARTMLPSSALPSHVTLPSRPASDVSHLSHQGFKWSWSQIAREPWRRTKDQKFKAQSSWASSWRPVSPGRSSSTRPTLRPGSMERISGCFV
jgi:hypothetical protein